MRPGPEPLSFHHVAFTVSNLERSVAWYEQNLGFNVWHRHSSADLEFVELERDGLRLELFSSGVKTKPLPKYRHELMDDLHVVGAKHVAIQVEALDKSLARLKAQGVILATNVDTASFGGHYVFIRDPDGILIELIETGG